MAPTAAYFLLHLFLNISLKKCENCLLNEQLLYCVDTQTCVSTGNQQNCQIIVKEQINCPWIPAPQYAYDEHFAKHTILPIVAAARNPNPQICFDNQLPTMRLFKVRQVRCSKEYDDVTCTGYTAVDFSRKAIVLAFRGSDGINQIAQFIKDGKKFGTTPYSNKGRVMQMFYESFKLIWNAGLGDDIQELALQYPDFELWIAGHSLGACLSTLSAAEIVECGIFEPQNIKIVLMGSPRFADHQFALWFSNTFPYSYHIVHANDYAPRIPWIDEVRNFPLYHPKTEVWYNNDMTDGSRFEICEYADQPFCSSLSQNLSTPDHSTYFNVHILKWGDAGCPTDRKDF